MAGFDLSAPLAVWQLPLPLREVSGLAAFEDGVVLAHQDERALIYAFDYRRGLVVRQWHMGEPVLSGDFEGIDVVRRRVTLMTSDGRLFSGQLPATGSRIAPVTIEDTGLGRRCELEGLAAGPGGAWLLPCKAPRGRSSRNAVVVYSWSAGSGVRTIALTLPSVRARGAMHPSAIAMTANGTYVVLFGIERAIGEFSATGALSLIALDQRRHPQPEGLAIASDGKLLVADEGRVAGERGTLAVYGRAR